MTPMLVLGLGNPILTDDGVGILVVREVQSRLLSSPAVSAGEVRRGSLAFAEASVGGLRLLEVLTGHDRAILVDAIQTADGCPGEVYRLTPGDFCASLHSGCSHDVDLFTALEFGRQLGLAMPQEIVIIAVEVEDVVTFSEQCTPAVEAAIPRASEMVLQELGIADHGEGEGA